MSHRRTPRSAFVPKTPEAAVGALPDLHIGVEDILVNKLEHPVAVRAAVRPVLRDKPPKSHLFGFLVTDLPPLGAIVDEARWDAPLSVRLPVLYELVVRHVDDSRHPYLK